MSVYLVRHRKEKTILGIFWDTSLDALWWNVDSIADPFEYEFAKMERGNLHFPGVEPRVSPWSTAEDEEDLPKLDWAGAVSDFDLENALYRAESMKWRKFPHATDPGGGIHQIYAGMKDASS